MPLTTLKCPHCGEDLPDHCRGLYPLHGIHADYLCPHCETVLMWQRPLRPLHQWLILISTLPMLIAVAILFPPLIWQLVHGLPPVTSVLIWWLPAAQLPLVLTTLTIRALRWREPWVLLVKKDPMQELWDREAAGRKLRSRPGSKW